MLTPLLLPLDFIWSESSGTVQIAPLSGAT
jgi:hypothetical protein